MQGLIEHRDIFLDYPFGMVMPNRYWFAAGAVGYRFGFNGKEGVDEIKGDNNSLDFGARIYDPRLGIFMSIDPRTKDYAWQTPYAYFSNSPINSIDFNGEGEGEESEPRMAQANPGPNRLKLPWAIARLFNPVWYGAGGKSRMQNYLCGCNISCDLYARDRKPMGINYTVTNVTTYKINSRIVTTGGQGPTWNQQTSQTIQLIPGTNYQIIYDHQNAPDQTLVMDNNGNQIGNSGMVVGTGTIPVTGVPSITITVNPGPILPTVYSYRVIAMPQEVIRREVKKLLGVIPFNWHREKERFNQGKNYSKDKDVKKRTINLNGN